MNVDPLPTSESTLISPPKALARFLLNAKPNPHPNLLRFLFSLIFVKALNKDFKSFLSIPTPVSIT